MSRARGLLILLVCSVLLAACGGDDGDGDGPTTAVRDPTGALGVAEPEIVTAPTPDPAAQRIARRALGDRHGSAVALDVETGRVLALVGTGGGDPTAEPVAPGSTLKALIGGLALDAGIVRPEGPLEGDRAVAPGAENYMDELLGPLTLGQALAKSSNTAFADLAVRLGPERLEAGLRRGGWGRPAAIDLPRRRRAVSVADVAPLVGADGSYVDPDLHQRTTALQLAQLAAAIGGDGSVPRASVNGAAPAKVGRLWRASTSAALREGMRLAVTDGTGATMRDRRVAIAAKTGTMPVPEGHTQASVIAVAPLPSPRVAVAVTVQASPGETGGEAAGPVARRLLRHLAG